MRRAGVAYCQSGLVRDHTGELGMSDGIRSILCTLIEAVPDRREWWKLLSRKAHSSQVRGRKIEKSFLRVSQQAPIVPSVRSLRRFIFMILGSIFCTLGHLGDFRTFGLGGGGFYKPPPPLVINILA